MRYHLDINDTAFAEKELAAFAKVLAAYKDWWLGELRR